MTNVLILKQICVGKVDSSVYQQLYVLILISSILIDDDITERVLYSKNTSTTYI